MFPARANAEVRLNEQLLLAYENGQAVFATRLQGQASERDLHHARWEFHHLP